MICKHHDYPDNGVETPVERIQELDAEHRYERLYKDYIKICRNVYDMFYSVKTTSRM